MTATNAAGSIGTNSFTVTVQDTTPPVISVPTDRVTTATTSSGAFVAFATSAADAVSGSVTTVNNSDAGSFFPVGTKSVSVSVSSADGAGNTSSGTFNITVTPLPPTPTSAAVPAGKALNISTRVRVQTGDQVLIGGFIFTGSEAKKVVIRAIGPSLATLGVSGALLNPALELYDGSGTILARNDDWQTTLPGGLITAEQLADLQASALAPSAPGESALIVTLSPGSYTAIVRGAGDTTGVGLVEVYDLSSSAAAQLANISTRGYVDTGDNVLIGGFIVGNPGAPVVVRASGPSLGQAGVLNPLANPTLELRDGNGALIALQ